MTLTVGRAGIDVTELAVKSWSASGDTATVSGLLAASSVANARVLRQQLNGYVMNDDEPVVPVTSTTDSTIDGFYRVLAADVAVNETTNFTGLFEFALSLERVRGFAGPIIETTILGAVRENDYSIVTAQAEIGVPDAVTDFVDDRAVVAGTARTTATGDVRVVSAAVFDGRQSWVVPMADYYDGAATIELGSPKVPAVGKQIQSDTATWRLSNGLARVSISGGSFEVSIFDGTSWTTAKELVPQFGGLSLAASTQSASLRVLRNSPEECIVRVSVEPTSALTAAEGPIRIYYDVALRRGEFMPRFTFFISSAVDQSGVELGTAEAGTVTSNYIEATSADAEGHKYVITTPHTATFDTVQGGFGRSVNASIVSFGYGLVLSGGSLTAADLVTRYMYAGSERAVVAAR